MSEVALLCILLCIHRPITVSETKASVTLQQLVYKLILGDFNRRLVSAVGRTGHLEPTEA